MAARKKKSKAVETSGKRKTAIARASVKPGKGRVRVNSQPIEIFEPELARRKAMEPLVIAEDMGRIGENAGKGNVDINVNTIGGGVMGQVDAIAQPSHVDLSSTTVGLKEMMRNSGMST